jgi:HPt (histidine-containing phosphotransfer) domain-containing protein
MIDWDRVAALREEVGPEDFEEVVELFLQEVDEEIEALAAGAPPEGLAEKLHFLKGSALSLGFRDFSDLCQTGEQALSSDPGAKVDLQQLQSSYQSSRLAFLDDLPIRFAS